MNLASFDFRNESGTRGSRARTCFKLNSKCSSEMAAEKAIQGGNSIDKILCLSFGPSLCPRCFFEKDTCMNWHFSNFFILILHEEFGLKLGHKLGPKLGHKILSIELPPWDPFRGCGGRGRAAKGRRRLSTSRRSLTLSRTTRTFSWTTKYPLRFPLRSK